jgi:hypothetical protein
MEATAAGSMCLRIVVVAADRIDHVARFVCAQRSAFQVFILGCSKVTRTLPESSAAAIVRVVFLSTFWRKGNL